MFSAERYNQSQEAKLWAQCRGIFYLVLRTVFCSTMHLHCHFISLQRTHTLEQFLILASRLSASKRCTRTLPHLIRRVLALLVSSSGNLTFLGAVMSLLRTQACQGQQELIPWMLVTSNKVQFIVFASNYSY